MNALTIIALVFAAGLVIIPAIKVILNDRRLKALQAKRLAQQEKTAQALANLQLAERSYSPYERAVESVLEFRQANNEWKRRIQNLENRISIAVTEKEFQAIKKQIETLEAQIAESSKTEALLYKKAKPIMDRIEAERRRQEEIARQERMKREEEERKARRKREEEEEERRAQRRREEAAAASSYSSSSSWSSSSDSGSSWSGGGGDSSGGGSSDSW